MLNDDIIQVIKNGVTDQQDLHQKLKKLGHDLTQSSISRKLKQLGISKSQGIYKIANQHNPILSSKVSFVPPNLIVITTPPGHANVIAAKIDNQLIENSKLPEFVGSIAGDDTIFIAVNFTVQSVQIIKDTISKIKILIDPII
jgi:transcriptional regulator of arginine metabolism